MHFVHTYSELLFETIKTFWKRFVL